MVSVGEYLSSDHFRSELTTLGLGLLLVAAVFLAVAGVEFYYAARNKVRPTRPRASWQSPGLACRAAFKIVREVGADGADLRAWSLEMRAMRRANCLLTAL